MYTRPRNFGMQNTATTPLKFSDRPMRHSVVHNITLASHLLEYSVVFQIYNDKTYLSFHGNDEFVVLAWEGEPPLVRTRVCRRDTDDFVVGLVERFILQVRVKVLEVEFVVDHRWVLVCRLRCHCCSCQTHIPHLRSHHREIRLRKKKRVSLQGYSAYSQVKKLTSFSYT